MFNTLKNWFGRLKSEEELHSYAESLLEIRAANDAQQLDLCQVVGGISYILGELTNDMPWREDLSRLHSDVIVIGHRVGYNPTNPVHHKLEELDGQASNRVFWEFEIDQALDIANDNQN